MTIAAKEEIWIGQAEVRPLPGNTMFAAPAAGGFIAAGAYAASPGEFEAKVRKELSEYGVFVHGVTGVRRLSEVLTEKALEDPLTSALRTLTTHGVALGTLFTFDDDNETSVS